MQFYSLYSGLHTSLFNRSETVASTGSIYRQGATFKEFPNKHDVESSVVLLGSSSLPDFLDDTEGLLLTYGFDNANIDVDNVELQVDSENLEVTGTLILNILPDHTLQPGRKRKRRYGTELGYLGQFKVRLLWETPSPESEKIEELRNWLQNINKSALRLHLKGDDANYGILKNGSISVPVGCLAEFMQEHRCKLSLSYFGQKLTLKHHFFLRRLCSNLMFQEDLEHLRIDYGVHALTQVCRERFDDKGYCPYIPFFKVLNPTQRVSLDLISYEILTYLRIQQRKYANFSV